MSEYSPVPFALRSLAAATCLSLIAACNSGSSTPPTGDPNAPQAPAAPAAPTGLVVTPGNAQTSVTWTASTGATSYDVHRSAVSGGPYTKIAAATSTSYTDDAVNNGTTYYYVIKAVNAVGASAPSVQASATPAPGSTPPVTPPTTPVTPPTSGPPTGSTFNFTSAPALSGVTMIQNRDSVIIKVPAVANARDFRILVQPTSVTANSDGTESVAGGTQFCAGVRQHQSRTRFVADPVSLFPYFFWTNGAHVDPNNMTPNFYGPPPTPWVWFDLDTPPHREIEVTGVTSSMSVTVEAIDRLCPFPGAIGKVHADISLAHDQFSDNAGNPWLDVTAVNTFPIVTRAEVIARYGSLIINGQGWAGGPNVQANPPARGPYAQPAPPNPPKVLARATITISPLASPPAAPKDFFDDFANANDTFTTLPLPNWKYPRIRGGQIVMQNSKWHMYGNGYTCCQANSASDGRGHAEAYVADGALFTNLADWAQGVLSEVTMIPRKAAHINATNYLHVTYEVPSFATSRRYWVVTLCGSSTPGQTFDSNGAVREQIVHTTFFYINTGQSPSTAGWNCLQVFNREGNSYAFGNWESMHNIKGGRPPVPPNNGLYDIRDYIYNTVYSIADPLKVQAYTTHPESDVVVLVNKPIPAANLPEVGGVNEQVVQSATTSPINVSPMQLDNPAGEVAWFYKVDANGNPVSPILDDQQLVSPRTKYDLYIRNNRLIMYVNGKPTLCNDFTTPSTTLNIADAAVGFHQVLYHSLGESQERFVSPDRGAAYHYRYNTPWVDQRTWDNMGFEENVSAPGDFDPRTCYVHTSRGPENNEP